MVLKILLFIILFFTIKEIIIRKLSKKLLQEIRKDLND